MRNVQRKFISFVGVCFFKKSAATCASQPLNIYAPVSVISAGTHPRRGAGNSRKSTLETKLYLQQRQFSVFAFFYSPNRHFGDFRSLKNTVFRAGRHGGIFEDYCWTRCRSIFIMVGHEMNSSANTVKANTHTHTHTRIRAHTHTFTLKQNLHIKTLALSSRVNELIVTIST